MNESWQIDSPGRRTIGTELKFVISSVRVPRKPGSTKPAVAWTTRPRRPIELLPSIRQTTSSGISTRSWVRPSTNSPGWITNSPSSSISTCSVRSRGGFPRSIDWIRWLWKTRNEFPRRMSTLAGWIIDTSNGSITIRPFSISSRIAASDRTEEGCRSAVTVVLALYDEYMPNIGPLELVIVLVIVLVIFGPKRLPGLGRSLGTGMREFKDSVTGKDKDEEVQQLEAAAVAAPPAPAPTEPKHTEPTTP